MPYVLNQCGHLFYSDLSNSVCIHIKAMCQLLLDYDSHHGIAPEIQEHANLMRDHTYEVRMYNTCTVCMKLSNFAYKCGF